MGKCGRLEPRKQDFLWGTRSEGSGERQGWTWTGCWALDRWIDEGTIRECPPLVHVHPPSGRSPPLKAGSRNRDRQLQVINRSVYYPVTYTVESGSRDNQKYLQLLFAWPEVTGIVDS